MNRKRKLKQMRRFLLQHGEITMEIKNKPDWFYRKGSHMVAYVVNDDLASIVAGHKNRYLAYQSVIHELKECLRRAEKDDKL